MPGKTPYIFPDGHFIVVEDHHHGLLAHGGIVESLVGHAAGGGAVADEGHHLVILPQQGSRPGHAQGDGHGVGGMPRHKGIRIAFRGLGEARHPSELPQMRKIRPATGQQLMNIRLMPHIKNQAV